MDTPPRKFILRKQLREQVPYSDPQIWRLEKAGIFPQHFKLRDGPMGANAWWQDEVDQWKANRIRGFHRPVRRRSVPDDDQPEADPPEAA
jgi:predicted DNA-binding transcriptional regulator AlpA